MPRRSLKSGSPLNQQQQELVRRENELRDELQKLQRMIEDAPRVAEEKSRQQREELLQRANAGGSRLDASVAFRDKRRAAERRGAPRRAPFRQQRREGRIALLVRVL